MAREIRLVLRDLRNRQDLWSVRTVPQIEEQLHDQTPDARRYQVTTCMAERKKRPAKDTDNYARPLLDVITYTERIRRDDAQVDRILIERQKPPGLATTEVEVLAESVGD